MKIKDDQWGRHARSGCVCCFTLHIGDLELGWYEVLMTYETVEFVWCGVGVGVWGANAQRW